MKKRFRSFICVGHILTDAKKQSPRDCFFHANQVRSGFFYRRGREIVMPLSIRIRDIPKTTNKHKIANVIQTRCRRSFFRQTAPISSSAAPNASGISSMI